MNRESGLLGLSETSGDVRDLLARGSDATPRAAEALAVFCLTARKKWIGALSAATRRASTRWCSPAASASTPAPVRARVCEGLDHLGVRLDAARNAAHAPVISRDASRVSVRVIPTDEELMIARDGGSTRPT